MKTLSDGLDSHRLVEIEYLKEGEETPSTRLVEPYSFERELPVWRVHTWDRTSGGARTYRLDRMRSARLPRRDVRAARGLRSELPARSAPGARLVLAEGRPLEARARRPAR